MLHCPVSHVCKYAYDLAYNLHLTRMEIELCTNCNHTVLEIIRKTLIWDLQQIVLKLVSEIVCVNGPIYDCTS
jgi:hypothetical protein